MNIEDQLCSKNNLNDLCNKLIYFTRDNNLFTYHHHNHQYQCSAQGRSFTANLGTKATILPKSRSSIANSGT